MRLAQLKYLSVLEKTKSITSASKKLFISQPALSESIKELEAELGYEVIKRSNKGIVFTPLGEMVLEKSKKILELTDEIKNLSQSNSSFIKGRLTVGGVPFACDAFLLDAVINIQEKYPNFKITLSENDSFHLLKSLGNNELDLAILLLCNEDQDALSDEIIKRNLVFTSLFEAEMCFWVGPKNPLAQDRATTMSQILQYPVVYYKGNFNKYTQSLFEQFVPTNALDLIRVEDRESIKKYVLKTKAAMIMPRQSSNDDLLIPLHVTDCQMQATVGIIKKQTKYSSLEENIFINELERITTRFKQV